MNLEALEEVKGFMPYHEGEALSKWAEEFSNKGPIMEIGTYCGKSSSFSLMELIKIINLFLPLIIIMGLKSIKLMKNILIMKYMILKQTQ